jgi:hypothetical protein
MFSIRSVPVLLTVFPDVDVITLSGERR